MLSFSFNSCDSISYSNNYSSDCCNGSSNDYNIGNTNSSHNDNQKSLANIFYNNKCLIANYLNKQHSFILPLI